MKSMQFIENILFTILESTIEMWHLELKSIPKVKYVLNKFIIFAQDSHQMLFAPPLYYYLEFL